MSRESVKRTTKTLIGEVVVEIFFTAYVVALPKARFDGVGTRLSHLKHDIFGKKGKMELRRYFDEKILDDVPPRGCFLWSDHSVIVVTVVTQ